MTKQASISDVTVKFCGKDWTLNANWESIARVEYETGEAYALVFRRMGTGIPRLVDVTTIFAAFALPHGKHSAADIRAVMPFDNGETLMEAWNHVQTALAAARPAEKKDDAPAEGSDKAPADPQ